jgi:hypothetical protein
MSANRLAAIVAVLSLATPAVVWPAERLQPGLWEVTSTTDLPGSTLPPLTTQTECLSQKDVDADPVPEIDRGACRVTDIVRSGDRITWKVDCGPLGKGEGEVVYRSPTAYEGFMKLDTGGTVVQTAIRARRLGGC